MTDEKNDSFESILDERRNKSKKENNESTCSILNEAQAKSTEEQVILGQKLAEFYGHLSKNGDMIYRISSYLVKDMDEDLKRKERKELIAVESLRGYTKDDILVLKTDASSKRGYIIINDKIDIPLNKLEGGDCKYFFDGSEALKEWKRLSEIEEDLCSDIIKTAEAAKSYIRRTIEKKQH